MSPHPKYQHVSLIYAGSRLISYGYNTKDVHSETMAINRMNNVFRNQKRKPKNLHIINFMIKRKTKYIGNSYSCLNCMINLIRNKIKTITVWYNNAAIQYDMTDILKPISLPSMNTKLVNIQVPRGY